MTRRFLLSVAGTDGTAFTLAATGGGLGGLAASFATGRSWIEEDWNLDADLDDLDDLDDMEEALSSVGSPTPSSATDSPSPTPACGSLAPPGPGSTADSEGQPGQGGARATARWQRNHRGDASPPPMRAPSARAAARAATTVSTDAYLLRSPSNSSLSGMSYVGSEGERPA